MNFCAGQQGKIAGSFVFFAFALCVGKNANVPAMWAGFCPLVVVLSFKVLGRNK